MTAADAAAPSVTSKVTLIPGAGVVIRTNSYVGLVGENAVGLLPDIREIEDTVAVPESTPRRGRHVVRALATLVANADRPLDVAFAATDNVGIAVYLSGAVFAEVDGRRREPAKDMPFDRGIPWPIEGLGLYLADAKPDEPGDERFSLIAGEVPAAGLLLHTPLGLRSTEIHAARSAEVSGSEVAADEVSGDGIAHRGRHSAEMSSESVDGVPTQGMAGPEGNNPDPDNSKLGHGDEPTGPVAASPQAAPSPDAPPADPPVPAPAPPRPPQVAPPQPPAAQATPPPQQRPQGQQPAPGQPAPAPRHAHTLPPNPAFQAESLQEPSGESRPPLPKQERQRPATEVGQVADSRVYVLGIRCSRGHLNHPRSWLCGVCGIRMEQLTGVLVEGERPPLGWLLLDNGSTYLLDENLVLGREPGTSGGARTGTPKPIRVVDETSQLSRRHIELRLVDWEVQLVDLGSANGTYVVDPTYGNREMRVPPHQPVPLAPGSHVRIGGRHFIFESPHART